MISPWNAEVGGDGAQLRGGGEVNSRGDTTSL